MADETDERLMHRFQRGDARAFEALVHRHRSPVFSFLVRLTGDRGRAEDLCQETFMRVVRGAAGWEERARFRTWLYAMARNLAVDDARRLAFRRTGPLEAAGEVAASEPPPDAATDAALLRPHLEAALDALPAEQREVFLLREQAGLRFAEIATVTGAQENTVKSRMRYALEGLRASLRQRGVAPEPADAPPRSAAR